jgi:hypothetical protein
MKMEFKNAIATAELPANPALAKSMTAVFSRTPNPPRDIGKRVIAPMIGIKIKK